MRNLFVPTALACLALTMSAVSANASLGTAGPFKLLEGRAAFEPAPYFGSDFGLDFERLLPSRGVG